MEAVDPDDEVKGNKRIHSTDTEGPDNKKKRKEKFVIDKDELPMNVPFKIVDGVRYLEPYWSAYRTRTKGRWIGRPMVEVFSKEFLSTNKNYAQIACKLGRIYVNGKQQTDVNYVLQHNDFIEHWGHRHEHPIRDDPIEIIAETEDLVCVNKPASLPVHACGQYAIHTVLAQLRIRYNKTGLRVLHRLDRTTSGVLLFAKNYETDIEFKESLKKGHWTKEYVCRVEGIFPEDPVECSAKIGNLVVSMGIQCVRDDGKDAHSIFRRLWVDKEKNESVVSVNITTGRTHQIRVHAQYLGYPIVGDEIYNSAVWGPSKGRNADYGKPFEQLCKDVQDSHKRELWHEEPNPVYEKRMEELAASDITKEKEALTVDERPSYDEVCLNCNVVKKRVPSSHFQLFLHCLKYETTKWSYKTALPVWAQDQ